MELEGCAVLSPPPQLFSRRRVLGRELMVLVIICVVLVSTAAAANYIYERSTIKGVGYRSHELAGQTASGDSGQKVVRTVSGSGSFYERSEFELNACKGTINYSHCLRHLHRRPRGELQIQRDRRRPHRLALQGPEGEQEGSSRRVRQERRRYDRSLLHREVHPALG
ncbi:MAG: Uncharacterized protein XD72_2419 [Methanothrix harundinacea]|uniref:Uncharacterized protein n=1 Tax=Methanothrix harundinacea TaxID=301375 RepID=A0A101FRP7_9EURY|nr:MAG: Uncharacterized protein XD72_2419 [Methanothrix harundinacea]